ncbi:MAG: hypothetical protein K1X74_06480 [Pirellulales bacterium]|nr:hypothetical protein [Pirellulales bacterium]
MSTLLATCAPAFGQGAAEIPADVFEFIAEGETARQQRVAELKREAARLKQEQPPGWVERLDAAQQELREHLKPRGPYSPEMPETPRVGDKGRLPDPWVTIVQVIDDRTMLVLLQGPWTSTKTKKDDVIVALRGFPSDTVADRQRYQVLVPVVISGTEDLRDGSRRTVMVAEPLDMRLYEQHWPAVVKQLKRRR